MATTADQSQLLTPEETAQRLNLTTEHVRRLLRGDELPGIKIGRAWRVDSGKLARWLEGRSNEGGTGQ